MRTKELRKLERMTLIYLIYEVCSDSLLEEAFCWLCKTRQHSSYNNSVWHLRSNWGTAKVELQKALRRNTYHLSPLKRYVIEDRAIDCWDAKDAVVLKALSLVLYKIFKLDVSQHCTHVKGHGGLKRTVRSAYHAAMNYKFVFKSDIKSYYGSIKHKELLGFIKVKIKDPIVLRLIEEYCNRLILIDGQYELINEGIPLGCSLSPLMSALYLKTLDEAMLKEGLYYKRYMDDWVVFTNSRRQLRLAVKRAYRVLSSLKLKMHPDKTFIGKLAKGIDFLGYRIKRYSLTVCMKTIKRACAKSSRLYERGASSTRIEKYWLNWRRWVSSGVEPWINDDSLAFGSVIL